MTQDEFDAVLKDNAARRANAQAGSPPPAAGPQVLGAARDHGIRLMGGFVSESRPAFEAVRAALAPYGLTLSPLHPARRAQGIALQTELSREGTASPYAPLLVVLDSESGSLRVFVQQFGGRQAPDFTELTAQVQETVDPAWFESVLRDYAVCMLRPRAA